ncbi:hypothetical protein F5882DRAFT_456518 [Hyaloscypha sp. PMI_1271]|nr:hypothetical protein F5882DRAFT_456518 [Hyaloscypha sp. PMI_1271]
MREEMQQVCCDKRPMWENRAQLPTIRAVEFLIAWNKMIFATATSFRLAPNFPTYHEPLTEYPNLKGFSQFGFGRRTCQGVESVEQRLFLVMGGLAWAFDIRKKRSRWGGI